MRGGDLILMARRRAGITQRELADRLGCRQATIARWERGDRQASFEDAEAAVSACGLQLDAHLAYQDRSWWPQIAAQLDLDPLERVRRLTPPGGESLLETLARLASAALPTIVVGEVAGALHGWPLALGTARIELCAPDQPTGALAPLITRAFEQYVEPRDRSHLAIIQRPAGTAGFADLARGAENIQFGAGPVRVAGLLDLIRMADASSSRDAHRHALAYQAVLDVRRARAMARGRPTGHTEERLRQWLDRQTPVP